ncbi:hypothetical protein ISD41_26870 [Pseudomonas aeruginosa]|nr:hypothetical protein [Pseudomonas aeruginosa]
MTTPIVQSISDEQLAELDELTAKLTGDWWVDWDSSYAVTASPSNIQSLIVRLRAAEADAKRYRWLRDSGRLLGDSMDSHADNFCVVTADGEDVMWFEQLDSAIDAAMERTP